MIISTNLLSSPKIKNFLNFYSFIIIFILFLATRLVGITNELSDFHHFRQTYTASFAKYFYENGYELFNPRLDILNYKNVSEFQIYPFLVACLYRVFGFHDYLGRILSLIFSAGTFFILYKLVILFFDKSTALLSIFFYTILPLSIFYSRVFMLEPLMLLLSVSMIYTFSLYIMEDNKKYFIYSIIITALTLLIKIPTVYMLLPILYLMYDKRGFNLFRRSSSYIFAILSFIPSVYWYFIHPVLFPSDSIVDKRIMSMYYSADAWEYYIELMKNSSTWKSIFLISIAEYHLAIVVFIFFIGGIILLFKNLFSKDQKSILYKSNIWVFFYWFVGFLIFILAFIAPNLAHEYYQLPIEIPCIIIASYFIRVIFEMEKELYKNIIVVLVILIIPFSALKVKSRLHQDKFYPNFAEKLKKISNKDDLIIVADNTPRTEVFYFSERKGFQMIIPAGFTFLTSDISEKQQRLLEKEIEGYRKKGARYFVTPYIEFPLYMSYLKNYLDRKYICKLGCDVTKERALLKDPTIPGFIYDLTQLRPDISQ